MTISTNITHMRDVLPCSTAVGWPRMYNSGQEGCLRSITAAGLRGGPDFW
jgi:hypothetical protein